MTFDPLQLSRGKKRKHREGRVQQPPVRRSRAQCIRSGCYVVPASTAQPRVLAVQCPSDPGSCIARRPPWPPLSRGAAPPLFRSQDRGAGAGGRAAGGGAGPGRGLGVARTPDGHRLLSRAPFPVTLLLRHTRAAEAGRMGRWLQRVQVRGDAEGMQTRPVTLRPWTSARSGESAPGRARVRREREKSAY